MLNSMAGSGILCSGLIVLSQDDGCRHTGRPLTSFFTLVPFCLLLDLTALTRPFSSRDGAGLQPPI